eukprot:gnl/TRDRNA2_/TRDRNA2_41907_c0_seq1.p1 gnl/TRDRNA2_/TRDRNA2_41907_c0~~gnl/TRDRNA2_/TRDRNA2_41907_c0_seq1.p1  ORF type:complete len:314 (+),score=72.62 gnl/TRDRNA2_/TRDRNA2_41907_c0_seq1:86-1027(+)
MGTVAQVLLVAVVALADAKEDVASHDKLVDRMLKSSRGREHPWKMEDTTLAKAGVPGGPSLHSSLAHDAQESMGSRFNNARDTKGPSSKEAPDETSAQDSKKGIEAVLSLFNRPSSGQVLSPLFSALSTVIQKKIAEFKAPDIAKTAFSFATAGKKDEALFGVLAGAVQDKVTEFKPEDLTSTAYAFAMTCPAADPDKKTESSCYPPLFSSIAGEVEQRMDEFKPMEIANTALAFASAGHSNPSLFSKFARVVEGRIKEFNEQALTLTAWAFAKADHFDEKLFTALAGAAEWKTPSLDANVHCAHKPKAEEGK